VTIRVSAERDAFEPRNYFGAFCKIFCQFESDNDLASVAAFNFKLALDGATQTRMATRPDLRFAAKSDFAHSLDVRAGAAPAHQHKGNVTQSMQLKKFL